MSDPAPHKEPERQYYFIEKAKEYVRKEAEEAGRPMTFCVTTFGCQMNARDSEKLRGILLEIGYEEASEEEADFVIFNTCTVRENANTRVYGRLGQLKSHKKKNPHMKIALCGCMMQEPEVVEKLRTSYRFVDLIFGTHNIYKFAELITAVYESGRMVIDIWKDTDKIVEDLPNDRKYSFKSDVLFVQTAGVFQQSGRFAEGLGAGKLLHERVSLLEAQLLPEGGRLAELGFGAEGHGAGGHLGHPLLHPAEGAVLEGGEHGLFFQPGVKDSVDDPVHDLFVPVQVGL